MQVVEVDPAHPVGEAQEHDDTRSRRLLPERHQVPGKREVPGGNPRMWRLQQVRRTLQFSRLREVRVKAGAVSAECGLPPKR